MPVSDLPEFDQALAIGHGNLDAGELAECHGVSCGLLVLRPDAAAREFLRLLEELQIVSQPAEGLDAILEELHRTTGLQLADEQMRLALWLPDDTEPLQARTAALAQWCQGFLAALGARGSGRLESLSEEAAEALADLQEIALAEVQAEPEEGRNEREEEEQAFAEIVEYVRIAVLMLREDLRGPLGDESIH